MQTYFAQSIFVSRTFWVNLGSVALAASQLPEVTRIIPLQYMPIFLAVMGVINIALRTNTVRPVAFISPSETKAVKVPSLPHST